MKIATALLVMASLAGCLNAPGNPLGDYAFSVPAHVMWSHPYPTLVVSVAYAEGRAPLPSSITHLDKLLHNLTDKENIVFAEPVLLDGKAEFEQDDYNWSTGEILEIIKSRTAGDREREVNGTTVLHVLFLNGVTHMGHEVGGIAHRNVLIIFPDNLNKVFELDQPPALVGKKPTYESVERWVVTHELGHVLGLVGAEVPEVVKRAASDGSHHSTRYTSPMYQYDQSDYAPFGPVTGVNYTPDQFDEYDLQDLSAFREKGRQLAPAGA